MSITSRGASPPVIGAAGSETASLDAAVLTVAASVDRWAATGVTTRAALLAQVIEDLGATAPGWHAAACEAKGLDPRSNAGAEELVAGVGCVARYVQQLRTSLREIESDRRPAIPGSVRHAPGGRLAIGVVPRDSSDRVLLARQRGEVWMSPGLTLDDVVSGQADAYRDPGIHRGLVLVLGAGNVASLGPNDALCKLFVAGKVVVLKASPVNDYLVEHWERALKALLDEGVLRIVRGGADAGAHLVAHSLVDEVHVTGSASTHDAIVFGPGVEGARRKSAGVRLVTKPVTAELGSVSPVVLVPGTWSSKELSYQARHVATMLVNNTGFNCLTPRVLLTWRHWPQRAAFLHELECVLASIPTRLAYYPGAHERHATFLTAHPGAHRIGIAGDGRLPWTVIRDLDAAHHNDVALNVEAFCGLLAETALDTATVDQFVDAAVEYCNDVIWGSLAVTVLAHPSELRDELVGSRIQAAVAQLRYGSIGLNLWHAWSFAFATTTWGAYPGHAVTDIQSGSGVVGNALMFDRPQKSVVTGPFRVVPSPPSFATAVHGAGAMRRFVGYQLDPGVVSLLGVAAAAARSPLG